MTFINSKGKMYEFSYTKCRHYMVRKIENGVERQWKRISKKSYALLRNSMIPMV